MKYASILLSVLLWLSLLPFMTLASNSSIGNKKCYPCHRNIKKTFLKNSHLNVTLQTSGTSPISSSCEPCHGPGEEHMKVADEVGTASLMIEGFGKVKGREHLTHNALCVKCHKSLSHMHWRGSLHELGKVRCVDCHTIHTEKKSIGIEVCTGCHREKKVQFFKRSHHPLREGEMTCTDCHTPHGGKGSTLIKTATVNEICYECHAEKRGPFIWEHAPVRENCLSCHNPHGSNYPSLLKTRVPYLCQSCHMSQTHSKSAYDLNALLNPLSTPFMRAKGCLNCHSMIHGSNHPSGARFTR